MIKVRKYANNLFCYLRAGAGNVTYNGITYDTSVLFLFPIFEDIKSEEWEDIDVGDIWNPEPVVGYDFARPVTYSRMDEDVVKALSAKGRVPRKGGEHIFSLKSLNMLKRHQYLGKSVNDNKVADNFGTVPGKYDLDSYTWNPIEHLKVKGLIYGNEPTLAKSLAATASGTRSAWKMVDGKDVKEQQTIPIIIVPNGKEASFERNIYHSRGWTTYHVNAKNTYVGNAGSPATDRNVCYAWEWFTTHYDGSSRISSPHLGSTPRLRAVGVEHHCRASGHDTWTPRAGEKVYEMVPLPGIKIYSMPQPGGFTSNFENWVAYFRKYTPDRWKYCEQELKNNSCWNKWSSDRTKATAKLATNYVGSSCTFTSMKDRDIDYIRQRFMDLRNEIHAIRDYKCPTGTWNGLAAEAVQNVGGFTGNGIAYLKDAKEFNETSKKYCETLKSIGAKKSAGRLRALAGAYLGIHYGYRLMWRDTVDIYNALQKFSAEYGISRCQATCPLDYEVPYWATKVEGRARYQVFYDRYYEIAHQVQSFLEYWDLNPTLGNIWDLIPLSFIVDWFTDFSNLLETLDGTYKLRSRYRVAAAGQSIKFSFIAKPTVFGLNDLDNIEITYYKRIYKSKIEEPLPSYTATINPLKHWFEGAALIVANK